MMNAVHETDVLSRLLIVCALAALGSFSGVFGTDWKEKTSRDFIRVKKTLHCGFCTVAVGCFSQLIVLKYYVQICSADKVLLFLQWLQKTFFFLLRDTVSRDIVQDTPVLGLYLS